MSQNSQSIPSGDLLTGDYAATLGLYPKDGHNDNRQLYKAVGNIGHAGQLGLGPRILNIDGATPLVANRATIVVLTTPTMWNPWPQAKGIIKSLWEVHARSISGLDIEYNLDTSESPVGQDGQSASVPTTTKRTQPSPSVQWDEVYGNGVFRIHQKWLFDMNHPDTHMSHLAAELADLGHDEDAIDDPEELTNTIPPWLFSTFSMSFIAIMTDPTGLSDRIIDAVYYANVFPTNTGMLGVNMTPGQAEKMEKTINYKAIAQHNENTRELGRVVLDALKLSQVNYSKATTIGMDQSGVFDTNTFQKAAESSGYGSGTYSNFAGISGLGKQVDDALRDFKLVETNSLRGSTSSTASSTLSAGTVPSTVG